MLKAFSNKNVLSEEEAEIGLSLLRQPTRERRATIRFKKATVNAKVHQTGYLFKRTGNRSGAIHKQYYFVLTEESLTFYRKKNDSRAKGEIMLPVNIVSLNKYVKKHAFQVIPLKFDRYNMIFVENPDELITLYADNGAIEKEWKSKMEAISNKIKEPYIFPDAIGDEDKNDDIGNDFNATQQTMHDKCNYFQVSIHFPFI